MLYPSLQFISPWIPCLNAYLTFPLIYLISHPNLTCPNPNLCCSPLCKIRFLPISVNGNSVWTVQVQKAWCCLWYFFFMCISNPLACSFDSDFTVCPLIDHFLPASQLLSWFKPLSPLVWTVLVTFWWAILHLPLQMEGIAKTWVRAYHSY